MICVYDSKTTDFNNNGITPLMPILCEVEEGRNGMFELELEHPFDLRDKWKNLIEDNIIKAPTPTGEQLFRIYRKYKSMSGIRVFARHIFYDLIDNFLEDCRPENTDGTGALNRILSSTQYPHKFTSISDVPGLKTAYFVRKNPVEAIFSEDGVLGRWGGELERDNFLIKLLQSRGKDRGVTIRYGKNLLGIEEDLDLDTVITRIMPQGYNGLFLPEKYIDSPYINNYPHPKIRKIEYSDIKIDEENGITEVMAITQLRERAQQEFNINKVDIPVANYKVDFIELSKTEEYKNYAVLERVYLCDTVTIKHLKLGFDLKAKVIKYKYNCLTNRYTEIELGAFKESMVSALNTLTSLKDTVSNLLQNAVTGTKMQSAIDHATELLTGALGGHVVFRPKEKPTEILIMDTDDILTAQRVWRWNLNGLGYSNKGVNGPYETAMTMDGYILGKFIAAHSITTNQVASDFGQKLDLSSNTSISLKVSNAINDVQVGGRNLLKSSNIAITNSSYLIKSYYMTENMIQDQQYTISFKGTLGVGKTSWLIYLNGGTVSLGSIARQEGTKIYKLTFNGKVDTTSVNNFINIYTSANTVTAESTIEWIKLEKGNKNTDYTIAPEDIQSEINTIDDIANSTKAKATELEGKLKDKANVADLTKLETTITTQYTEMKTTVDGVSIDVGNINTKIDDQGKVITKVNTNFDFTESGMKIGKSDSPLQISIDNQAMQFLDTGKDSQDTFVKDPQAVAYINGKKMYIDSLEVLSSLLVGVHKIEKYDANTTLVRWVGGN